MKTARYMVLYFWRGRIEVLDDGDGITPFVTDSADDARSAADATTDIWGVRTRVIRLGGKVPAFMPAPKEMAS